MQTNRVLFRYGTVPETNILGRRVVGRFKSASRWSEWRRAMLACQFGCASPPPSLTYIGSLDAMIRSPMVFLTLLLSGATCLGDAIVSENECVGTWKMQPSLISARSGSASNAPPRIQFPTNLVSFELRLYADGSFVATNLPAGAFFEWWSPELSARGTWYLWDVTNYPPEYKIDKTKYSVPSSLA